MVEIDQASARFSLSNRQVRSGDPYESSRRSLSTIENMPVPPRARIGAAQVVAKIASAPGRRSSSASTRTERHGRRRPRARGVDSNVVTRRCRCWKNLPRASTRPLGQQREEAKLMSEFLGALISGTFLVFALRVLLYKR